MTAGPFSPPTGPARVLAVCDGLLREIGRRQHRFSWLRGHDDWLAVDGYYPANKLVVYCGADPDEQRLYEQLVPQHGLYLLVVEPEALPDDPLAAQALVREQLEQDGWSPRPDSRPVAAEAAVAVPGQPSTPPKPAKPPKPPKPPPRHPASAGFGIGLALSVAVLAEAYLGLIVLAIDNGYVVLGLGLLLDAAARVLGTLSTRTWSSLLIGSPRVVDQEQPAKAVAIAALAVSALGVVLAIL